MLPVAADVDVQREAGQALTNALELVAEGEGHEAGVARRQFEAELLGELIADAAAAQGRDRQPAGGDHQ